MGTTKTSTTTGAPSTRNPDQVEYAEMLNGIAFIGLALTALIAIDICRRALRFGVARMAAALEANSPKTLVDHADGAAGLALVRRECIRWAVYGGLLCLGGLGWLAALPRAPLGALLTVAFGGAILWMTRKSYIFRTQSMRVAKAGELDVPTWPLQEGRTIDVAFRRELLDGAGELRSLRAALLLMETRQSFNTYTRRFETRTLVVERHELGDGGARRAFQGLRARWRFEVPPPNGVRERTHVNRLLSFFRQGPQHEWLFHIDLDVEGLLDNDSCFALRVAPVA